jgi:malonyl-CoA decarboxylase
MRQSHGLMVNYLYDVDHIEKNHEAFAEKRQVVAATAVTRLARAAPPVRDLVPTAV